MAIEEGPDKKPKTKRCPNCGTANDIKAKRCKRCNYPFEEEDSPPPTPST
ncbi:hypothetical protein [Thermaurantimonas aggregans]|nr:hypothetical protein [Thermaurantimonas aggregans]MCX8148078.1 hypothetical protein [Thermaurantimonas aggregans]